MLFYIVTFAAVIALGCCNNDEKYTITEEAWFDVLVRDMDGPGQDYRGRFTVGLFGEIAPMTVLNFASLAKGYKKGDKTLTYKNTPVHRIVQDFVVQMGDVSGERGFGGTSIFGERFNDEGFELSHRSPGWVSMANHGPDTNNSQFFVMLVKARWLDGKHVVFGKVIQGMDVIETLAEVPADPKTAAPEKIVTIVDCGLNNLKEKYVLQEDQLDSTKDL